MNKLRSLLQTKEVLAHVCGCDDYEGGLLTQTLTFQEKLSLSKITMREMNGLQELLFRIMTTSYDLQTIQIIEGLDLQNAIVEALSVINQRLPRYSGNYWSLVRDYELTPLHIKVLSRKMSVSIVTCAENKNWQMQKYRQDQKKYLNNWEVSMTFHEFMSHHFSFEDAITILHQHTLKQIKEFRINSKELDSCVGWVKQTLMLDYKMSEGDSMRVITTMIMNDKPLLPHLANLANPFRNHYNRIYKADDRTRYGMDTLAQSNLTTDQNCFFLAEQTQPTGFTPYTARVSTEICENLVFPVGVVLLGAMGAVCVLLANSNCLKRMSVKAFGLFSNCKRKQKFQHPSRAAEMDVELEAARKTA